ncbi:MarR family winged helix-turn-helix transcriptional regulator [Salirhabdus sp. Marseille-P4669]|uniref:MarR family winged helix-turn-helix transcriptional regulator n=1 Tax=Salirhabdus sp. Marseille-P4669 TaxID=2042310 RepID=UPI000C7CB32E|nr:MarR family transcriptional regulator [Salirhabdus sp. Marseille-P4669]
MNPSQKFFHHFIMLYRPFENKLNVELGKHNLHRAQWTILYYLFHYSSATLVELANYQGVEKPTVTRTMNRLEELGYIQQIPSTDKREKRVELSKKGVTLYNKVRLTIDEYEQKILTGISVKEQLEVIRIMQQIRNNIMK